MNEEESTTPQDETNDDSVLRSEEPVAYNTPNTSASTPRSEVIMELYPEAQIHLNRIRQWTYFFGIMGYIGIGLMLILGVGMFALGDTFYEMSETPFPSWIGLLYVVFAGVYIYPVVKLMEFSSKMKTALGKADGLDLNGAFLALRQHYGFLGWMAVAVFILYILAFVALVIFGVMAS